MNLIYKASLRRIYSEFGKEDLVANFTSNNTVSFSSNTQPGVSSSPNSLEKQIKGTNPSMLSDNSMKQIQSYRAYKKRKKEEEVSGKKSKTPTPVMPESLKKDIRRAKTIKQDDIAPTV